MPLPGTNNSFFFNDLVPNMRLTSEASWDAPEV